MQVTFCGDVLEYQLIRSARRKTIALQVSNAQVTVRAPKFVNVSYIDKLIKLKLPWLKQKVSEQKHHALLSPDLTLQLADKKSHHAPTMYIDGLPHNIVIDFGQKNVFQDKIAQRLTVVLSLRYKQHELHSEIISAKVKAQIQCWLKVRIEEYVSQKLAIFSPQMSLYASAFKVRKYKARWGSCNSRGELSFNYLLKMLPSWVIDYVIIHELCHLKHMNHSIMFWQLVAQHCPEYQHAKNWLREHQPFLKWP